MAAQLYHAACANNSRWWCKTGAGSGRENAIKSSRRQSIMRDSEKVWQSVRSSSRLGVWRERHIVQYTLVPPRRRAEQIVLRSSLETSVEKTVDNLEESLVRMRELVDLAGGKSEAVDDASLVRFLKGFSLNVDVAAEAFAKHQKWETSFKPKGFISEVEIEKELSARKSYLQGKDKQGRPISVIIVRNHFHNKEDFDEFQRFIVYSLDKVVAAASESPDGKFDCVIDFKGLGFRNLDSKAFIAGFDIYQSHYPERLEKMYMVNAPLIFNGLWKVVSSFINETTNEKIIFVEKKKAQEILLRLFDADQLPAEFGGTANLVLLQDAVVPGWPPANFPLQC